jgi:hypothetical protein
MTDDELIEQFEKATLESFHHADHVRVAFVYLSRHPALQALERFSDGLKRFAAAHGKQGLYHATITWAYVLLIQERMARAGRVQSWEEFAGGNPDLLQWRGGILERYYTGELLASDLARAVFVFPDRVL